MHYNVVVLQSLHYGPSSEINILEACKILIFDQKIAIPFVNGVKLSNFDKYQNFNFLTYIWGIIVERVKFWLF